PRRGTKDSATPASSATPSRPRWCARRGGSVTSRTPRWTSCGSCVPRTSWTQTCHRRHGRCGPTGSRGGSAGSRPSAGWVGNGWPGECRGASTTRSPSGCGASAGRLQLREVAVRVAVVLERFLEHHEDALLDGILAVLEDVHHLGQVGGRHRLEVVVHALR